MNLTPNFTLRELRGEAAPPKVRQNLQKTTKPPEPAELAPADSRSRVLSDDHFEFRVSALQSHRREARLRSEHARVYPCLTPDLWELAAVVTEKVTAGRLQRHRALLDRDRVLDPQHFEFRNSQRPLPKRAQASQL
jgi:hypothetical protein